MMPS
jgi:hypothetical protein